MNHLLLGASLAFAVWLIAYMLRGFRASFGMILILPFVMALAMLWAVAPDLPRLFGFHELYMRLAIDPRCDVFLMHYTIDTIETDSVLHPIGLTALFALVLFIAWRELRLVEGRAG